MILVLRPNPSNRPSNPYVLTADVTTKRGTCPWDSTTLPSSELGSLPYTSSWLSNSFASTAPSLQNPPMAVFREDIDTGTHGMQRRATTSRGALSPSRSLQTTMACD